MAGIPKVNTKIVKWEHKPGHRDFSTYNLPKWVKHPDFQKPVVYIQPEDYMGTRKKGNYQGWNVAHIGAQCGMFGGQGVKMLSKATPLEINAPDFVSGYTPLHWAVLADNPKAAIWLLKHGANPELKDRWDRTPEDLIDEHWGDYYQRWWAGSGAPINGYMGDGSKLLVQRTKQMKEAFKGNWVGNDFDIEAYADIEV